MPTFRFVRAASVLCVLSVVAAGCSSSSPSSSETPKAASDAKSSGGKHAVIDTDKGPIELEFFDSASPKAVENFRLLAERGYYKGVIFHRVVKGFMIQGGDPTGTGSGGESAWGESFPDDIDRSAEIYSTGYRRGIVAMANPGPNTNGSQFFIMHMDYDLPPNYVIFAKVISGMSAVDAIAEAPTTLGGDGGMSKPVTPVAIKSVTVKP
jgi:cyclophilin family peptidyl-prolyl cis-trans isomerase